jgi:hypothetical protein
MRFICIAVFTLLLSGCPGGKPAKPVASGDQSGVVANFSVSLLCTDLGLGDGALIRAANESLEHLMLDGKISLITVGTVPAALANEGGTGEVGMPVETPETGESTAGTMTIVQAANLAEQLHDSDIIVVSGPLAAVPVLHRIDAGELQCELVLMLDREGPELPKTKATVLALDYDIAPAAFLVGVAAGTSSRTQAFLSFTSTQDPHADEFVKALENGIRFRMAGGGVLDSRLTPDFEGLVNPEDFSRSFTTAKEGLQCDHFIVALGRATPSIMHALSSKPANGFVLGGYGDFRQVRPARVVSCIVKDPGPGLTRLLGQAQTVAEVTAGAQDGVLKLGLSEGAVDVTDLAAYSNFNEDADDIREALKDARDQIEAGELEVLE